MPWSGHHKTPTSASPNDILTWLERNTKATQEPFPSPGMGSDIRIKGDDVLGARLVIDDHPIQMELFHRAAPENTR